jgi:hypothetical protein
MINLAEAISREVAKIVFAANQDNPEEKEVYREACRIESQLLALAQKIDSLPELRKRTLVKIRGED